MYLAVGLNQLPAHYCRKLDVVTLYLGTLCIYVIYAAGSRLNIVHSHRSVKK